MMSIQPLQLDIQQAAFLHNAVLSGIHAAKGTAHSLVLTLDDEALGFNGWDSYDAVVGKHDPKTQAKKTTLLYRGETGMLERLRRGLPGFDALERMAIKACGGRMVVAFVHVLQQSSAQACFQWHTDTETGGYERVRYTVVVLLSNTRSSMQIQGEPEFFYEGAGASARFPSAEVHRSGAATPGTIKIALMMKREGERLW